MSDPKPITVDECLRLLQAMAEDLREYADAAREAGDNIEATEQLLADYDALFKRSPGYWLNAMQGADAEPLTALKDL
jgi:hypothetical protein